MEDRLIRPSLENYKKRHYIKKYWWFLLISMLFLFVGIYVTSTYFSSSDILMFTMTTLFCIPLVLNVILYHVLYEKHNVRIWEEHDRWENEPEIKEIRLKEMRKFQTSLAIGDILDSVKILEKYNKGCAAYVLKNDGGKSYIVCETENVDLEKIHIKGKRVIFNINNK